jgi:hypothetical protein
LSLCRPLRSKPGGKALQHQAQFEYLLQVSYTDLGYEHASPGSEEYKAFCRQSLQGFTDRGAPYLQVLHQSLFVNSCLGREFQRDDLVPDELVGFIA